MTQMFEQLTHQIFIPQEHRTEAYSHVTNTCDAHENGYEYPLIIAGHTSNEHQDPQVAGTTSNIG
jgi:hypothetical protein